MKARRLGKFCLVVAGMPRTQGIALLALGLAFAVPDQAPPAHTPQQKATVAAAPAAAGIKERLQHLGYPLLGGAKKLIEVLTSATVPVGPFPDPSGMLKEHQVMVTWWCDQPTHGETCAPPPAAATTDMHVHVHVVRSGRCRGAVVQSG